MILNEKIKDLISDPDTIKIVASVGKAGTVSASVKQSLSLHDEKLIFREFIETSESNKNMIYSLWFEKPISILLLGKDMTSYEIKGIPVEAVIEGPLFQQAYEVVQERFDGKYDLSGLWIIDPVEVRDKNPDTRFEEQYEKYPIVTHLDRSARQVVL